MEKHKLISTSIDKIAKLIAAQRMAAGGMYEVIFLKEHFVCRKLDRKAECGTRLVLLRSRDIDEGLLPEQWEMIRIMLNLIIKRGELK